MDFLFNINKSFNSQSELTIEYIETFLKSTPITKKDVESYLLEPEGFPYGRYTLFMNSEVEVCVLHWIKGSKSSIHDHASSDCTMLVIEGELVNRNFALNENNELVPSFTIINKTNDVVTISNSEIHELEQVGEDSAITLHVYYPPLEQIKIF